MGLLATVFFIISDFERVTLLIALLTKNENNIMAGSKLYFKDKELNKTSIAIAKLRAKVMESD